jgi:hypothetical protein
MDPMGVVPLVLEVMDNGLECCVPFPGDRVGAKCLT